MSSRAYCYMLLCARSALYTGWTKNVQHRLEMHQKGKGAIYTKINPPVELVYWETQKSVHAARMREIALKKFARQKKDMIVQGRNHPMENSANFRQYSFFVSTPGRVNLLGEHVDYNGGPVLPVAIDRCVSLWANPLDNVDFKINALDMGEAVTFSLNSLRDKLDIHNQALPAWALYPAGVIWATQERQLPLRGFESLFTSNIPIGAGLSSSAAVEISFAALLRELCQWPLDDMELAILCQHAENRYVGVNCGILDQFSCANGVKDAVLYLNTANLEWSTVPLPPDLAIVIANSNKKRTLATSAYNERRESCQEALQILQQHLPAIQFLGDVQPEELEAYSHHLPEIAYKRAKHVVDECRRVELAVACLRSGDVAAFGNLMKAGHESLKTLYEVSIPEIDILVDLANSHPACYGSRITGGGFGGCTVSLLPQKQAQAFINYLAGSYKEKTGIDAEIYLCKASDGVSVEWRQIPKLTNDL